eukprot:4157995-Lingulodinium_polyedra.AAC.1
MGPSSRRPPWLRASPRRPAVWGFPLGRLPVPPSGEGMHCAGAGCSFTGRAGSKSGAFKPRPGTATAPPPSS